MLPRFILIDNVSGQICGDSAEFAPGEHIGSIGDAAAMLDASLGLPGRDYRELCRNPGEARAGYEVYRADIHGRRMVGVIEDGEDPEMIRAVRELCDYAGFVLRLG